MAAQRQEASDRSAAAIRLVLEPGIACSEKRGCNRWPRRRGSLAASHCQAQRVEGEVVAPRDQQVGDLDGLGK